MHATHDPSKKSGSTGKPLLKPLASFYEAAGHALPPVRFIDGDAMPQPYRSLLVHDTDMTSTLEKFHSATIRIRALASRRNDMDYEREVLLVTRDAEKIVEFGAIHIALGKFPDEARDEVLREETPLGAILLAHRIAFRSAPRGFFEIDSNELISAALALPLPQTLYGRCNVLLDAHGGALAEIVEILPPAKK